MPHWKLESSLLKEGYHFIAGVDEAGRGPLAGPVVAAAVVFLERPNMAASPYASLDDSKKLSPAIRQSLCQALCSDPHVHWAIARVDSPEIDRINILQATHRAMRQAVACIKTDFALIDGLPVRNFPLPSRGVVKGDCQSYSIAAASIIAKVTRDQIMLDYDRKFPEYGFASHKGYGTARHLEALRRHGPCPIHRQTFAPVAQCAHGLEFT